MVVFYKPLPQDTKNGDKVNHRHRQGVSTEGILEGGLRGHHLGCREGQHTSAQIHECGVALNVLQKDAAAPNQDRDADQQTQNHQQETAVGCAGDAEDVVHSHHHVRHHNRSDGGPERGGTLDMCCLPIFVLGYEQLVGDPDQHRTAREEQPRKLQQPHNDQGQQAADNDRTSSPDNHGPALEVTRHIARRQCNHNGIVTGQDQINGNDRCQCGGKFNGKDVHISYFSGRLHLLNSAENPATPAFTALDQVPCLVE